LSSNKTGNKTRNKVVELLSHNNDPAKPQLAMDTEFYCLLPGTFDDV
jgi:hypothetical protein